MWISKYKAQILSLKLTSTSHLQPKPRSTSCLQIQSKVTPTSSRKAIMKLHLMTTSWLTMCFCSKLWWKPMGPSVQNSLPLNCLRSRSIQRYFSHHQAKRNASTAIACIRDRTHLLLLVASHLKSLPKSLNLKRLEW